MYFPLKLKISLWGQLFLIIWVKSNTEKWKLNVFIIFFTCPSHPKFYYITHLCEIEVLKKIDFSKNFCYTTMFTFLKSQFYMKNIFFWRRSCWCSSKIKRGIGGAYLAKFLIIAPFPFAYFLSFMNITYLKWTDFWCRIRI